MVICVCLCPFEDDVCLSVICVTGHVESLKKKLVDFLLLYICEDVSPLIQEPFFVLNLKGGESWVFKP